MKECLEYMIDYLLELYPTAPRGYDAADFSLKLAFIKRIAYRKGIKLDFQKVVDKWEKK